MLPSVHPIVRARFRMGPQRSRANPRGRVAGACIMARDVRWPFVRPSSRDRPMGHASDLQHTQQLSESMHAEAAMHVTSHS